MSPCRLVRAAAATALIASVAACSSGGTTGTAGTTAAKSEAPVTGPTGTATDKVEVKDFAFKPGTIKVKAGTTVTWTFDDTSEHTVASKTGETEIPQSAHLAGGKTYTHVFATAGSFGYHCTLHNSMTGTVVVTPA